VVQQVHGRDDNEAEVTRKGMVMFSKIALAKMVDSSILRPDATEDDVVRYCEEGKEFHFATVVVLP
jgi:hypothetical protein